MPLLLLLLLLLELLLLVILAELLLAEVLVVVLLLLLQLLVQFLAEEVKLAKLACVFQGGAQAQAAIRQLAILPTRSP